MRYTLLLILSVLISFSRPEITAAQVSGNSASEVMTDSMVFHDNSRNRLIPVAMFYPKTGKLPDKEKLVILSHGYGANQGGDYMKYSYLCNYLASQGYVVISIQHELPTDSLIPMAGIPQIVRRPHWERGVENISFVLKQTKKAFPKLDYQHLILIGHSNGGDMSMLFCSKYPQLVDKVISLDSRRVAFPRTAHPRVYSLRSSDQEADEGVLPTADEQKKYGMKIIKLPNTIHNDMSDIASPQQRKEINDYVLSFLNEN
jgi:predicted esterase